MIKSKAIKWWNGLTTEKMIRLKEDILNYKWKNKYDKGLVKMNTNTDDIVKMYMICVGGE